MKKFLFITLLFLYSFTIKSQIIINELMQSNIDCIMDDTNEFPDSWVELYNTSSTPINLEKFHIGLNNDINNAWQLPSIIVSSNSFVLIYCDNKAVGTHTDFKIDSNKGCSIYLFKDKLPIDSICNLKKQPSPNISYGRENEHSSTFGYQETPTPNKQNCGSICEEILNEPIFNIKGGVYTNTNNLKINLSVPENAPTGTKLRYTTNGSEPTENSPEFHSELTIYSNTVIRAKLFCKGYLSPRSKTESYIFFNRELTLPVISIVTNNEFFYDNKKGIYVEGIYNNNTKNYEYNWRRPVNFEFFENANESSKLNQLCETRISGAASRGNKYKSLALFANKRFGSKRFSYEFFPDQRPGETNFKSIVLRNAGNDFDYLYMRDAIAQKTMSDNVDIDYQAWRPSIVYINGNYTGILNIRERGNENNIFTNYDELEDIDLVENWNSLKVGDMDNLNSFKSFFNDHNHSLKEYSKWMDINEFINFWIMNCYFNNVDFPSNNFMMWRSRKEDGIWRFIAKDVDYIMGIYGSQGYDYKYFTWLYNNDYDSNIKWGNTYESTRLFRRLMEIDEFNQKFIDTFAIYMGCFLNYDNIWDNVWEPMYNIIKTEYPYHRKLINQWWPNYASELSNAQTWIKNRTSFMYSHLSDSYSLGQPFDLEIKFKNKDEADDIEISFNDIILNKNKLVGKYYPNRTINLKGFGKSSLDNTIKGWDIIQIKPDGKTDIFHQNGATCSFVTNDCSKLIINYDTEETNDITETNTTENENVNERVIGYYNLNGIRFEKLQKGLNIIKYTDGSTKLIKY